MRIESGVSPDVTAGEVLFSLVGFTLLYGALMVADIYLLAQVREGRPPPARAARPTAEPAGRAGAGLREETTMDLNTLWFVLVGVLFTGFFVLEGFDYGVGILLPFLGKTDAERRRDHQHDRAGLGRQRGVDPDRRAAPSSPPSRTGTRRSSAASTSRSFLMLVALIVRGVAFEFRSKDENPAWRAPGTG